MVLGAGIPMVGLAPLPFGNRFFAKVAFYEAGPAAKGQKYGKEDPEGDHPAHYENPNSIRKLQVFPIICVTALLLIFCKTSCQGNRTILPAIFLPIQIPQQVILILLAN